MIKRASEGVIKEAAEMIKAGEVVAFPTETVYGLGANVFDADAVGKIFALKGRPADNPLIVHIGELEDLGRVAEITAFQKAGSRPAEAGLVMTVKKLADKFWPGPLTLVLPKRKEIPDAVSAGLDTVAVRMPANLVARALIKESGMPIAAPSANKSGRPSPTDASHVAEDFGDELFIIDDGKSKIGLESTVLDVTVSPPVILRSGAVTIEMLAEILPEVIMGGAFRTAPKSPGQKYRHYAPEAPLFLIPDNEKMMDDINILINENLDKKVGVLASKENSDKYKKAFVVIVIGSKNRPDLCAKNLFSSLRKFDKLGVDMIISESFSDDGVGRALMERLKKAANGN